MTKPKTRRPPTLHSGLGSRKQRKAVRPHPILWPSHLLGLAEQYLHAYDQLTPRDGDIVYSPKYLALTHSVELALKAYLAPATESAKARSHPIDTTSNGYSGRRYRQGWAFSFHRRMPPSLKTWTICMSSSGRDIPRTMPRRSTRSRTSSRQSLLYLLRCALPTATDMRHVCVGAAPCVLRDQVSAQQLPRIEPKFGTGNRRNNTYQTSARAPLRERERGADQQRVQAPARSRGPALANIRHAAKPLRSGRNP